MRTKIYSNVHLGTNCIIEDNCEIGHPPRGKREGELKTIIGDNAYIRSGTIIYADVKVGKNFQTGHNVLIREGNNIGDNVSVGSNSTIEAENKIGNNVRIHSLCFLEKTTIFDNVLIGPGVVCTDNPHPALNSSIYDKCVMGATIKKNAKIGAGAVILSHVVIDENALVGSGSIVTKNVKRNMLAVGNPARETKKITDIVCVKNSGKKHNPYNPTNL